MASGRGSPSAKARPPSADAVPGAVARAAREAVGLGPEVAVRDICGLLDRGGVKLLLLETKRDSFFGLSIDEPDGGPAVVVNTWERISVERWIFTAAHELGHLLLHPHEYQRDATDLPEDAEREADEFASEFLMPECAFAQAWGATSGHSLLSRVLKVKRIFRVSYKTVLYLMVDLVKLGVMDRRRATSIARRMHSPILRTSTNVCWSGSHGRLPTPTVGDQQPRL